MKDKLLGAEDFYDFDECDDKVCDAATADTIFIMDKIFEEISVYESLTLTVKRKELSTILKCLNKSDELSYVDFTLNVNRDSCHLRFTRK